MSEHDGNVIADLINVYRSAIANADEVALRSRDPQLPMMERLKLRHQAHQYQELADQALRMVNELTSKAAA
jgi:cellobiose phosphorylase